MLVKDGQEKVALNWDVTSDDYIIHRRGYPGSFFRLIRQFGIGMPWQQILDIGTGTGALAFPLARQHSFVTGVDISPGQIATARRMAEKDGLDIRFIVAPAEDIDLGNERFDVITASMCWDYFDRQRILKMIGNYLHRDGVLMLSHIIWKSDSSDIVRATEELVSHFNRSFLGFHSEERVAHWGVIPEWSAKSFQLQTYHRYTENIAFTHKSWRGRFRASKWIGAALSEDDTRAFDSELQRILNRTVPEKFFVPHNIVVQIFRRNNPRFV
ncbi:class I SAM-dependent methyltransferase [Herbaspirillum lusitanum]|uniref:Class I SAM-dependent methyltransferase n=1 Tax=Herbaspirillum lusitanum TaxID=213312 RepID=A0ABW9AEA6_9BURK